MAFTRTTRILCPSLLRSVQPALAGEITKYDGNARYFSVSTASYGEKVGFVGLGNMGGHMARNLLKKGYDVIAYDISTESLDKLKQDGAAVAKAPADVAADAKTIVTMLPSSPHVLEVYTGKTGLLSTAKEGSLFLDSSTIDPSVSQDVAKLSAAQGATYMDAPVSGGVNAARDGILTFMVGGEKFSQAKAILDNMGKNVVHCGDVGTGQAAKICNNMLLAICMIGTSETLSLGKKLGLDPKLLSKILNTSSGRSWSSELYNPCPGVLPGVPSSNNYEGGFGAALMSKDLGLAQNAAVSVKSVTPLGSLAHQIYLMLINHGYSQKDFSSVFEYLEDISK